MCWEKGEVLSVVVFVNGVVRGDDVEIIRRQNLFQQLEGYMLKFYFLPEELNFSEHGLVVVVAGDKNRQCRLARNKYKLRSADTKCKMVNALYIPEWCRRLHYKLFS